MVKRKTGSRKAARDTVVDTAAQAGEKTGGALRRVVAGAAAGAVSGALIGAASGFRRSSQGTADKKKKSPGARSNTSTKRKMSRNAGASLAKRTANFQPNGTDY
jgi:hypothetical protein